MVDKFCASYLYQKRGVYYFSKQVLCDVSQDYKRDRIVFCLKTKSVSLAKRMCDFILQRLHDYCLSLRLSAMPLPAAHLVHNSNGHDQLTTGPTLSEARDAYNKLNGLIYISLQPHLDVHLNCCSKVNMIATRAWASVAYPDTYSCMRTQIK